MRRPCPAETWPIAWARRTRPPRSTVRATGKAPVPRTFLQSEWPSQPAIPSDTHDATRNGSAMRETIHSTNARAFVNVAIELGVHDSSRRPADLQDSSPKHQRRFCRAGCARMNDNPLVIARGSYDSPFARDRGGLRVVCVKRPTRKNAGPGEGPGPRAIAVDSSSCTGTGGPSL